MNSSVLHGGGGTNVHTVGNGTRTVPARSNCLSTMSLVYCTLYISLLLRAYNFSFYLYVHLGNSIYEQSSVEWHGGTHRSSIFHATNGSILKTCKLKSNPNPWHWLWNSNVLLRPRESIIAAPPDRLNDLVMKHSCIWASSLGLMSYFGIDQKVLVFKGSLVDLTSARRTSWNNKAVVCWADSIDCVRPAILRKDFCSSTSLIFWSSRCGCFLRYSKISCLSQKQCSSSPWLVLLSLFRTNARQERLLHYFWCSVQWIAMDQTAFQHNSTMRMQCWHTGWWFYLFALFFCRH